MLSEFFKQIPFLKVLEPSEVDELIPFFMERKYSKGSILFFEGDLGDELYIVKEGTVKVYRPGIEKEVILALFRPGDYFGEMSVIQHDQVRSATAETTEPTTVYVLKHQDFKRFLEDKPTVTLKLLHNMADRLRKSNEIIEDLSLLDVRSRVYKAIIRLSKDFGVAHPNGLLVDVKLTHQQLADMVGSRRDTVTKILLELQDEGLISIRQKRFLISDPVQLQNKIFYE